MKHPVFLIKTLALMACLLCSMSAVAAEAYACYTPENTTLTFYYDDQRSTREGTTYDLNEGGTYPTWCSDGTYSSVTLVVFDSSFANARPTTTYYWFHGMNNLSNCIGMEYLNTSQVTDMSYMFYDCHKMTYLDVSSFNTANVTNMKSMFYGCYALTSLDLSGFSTANVMDLVYTFNNCYRLTSLDLSSFNTVNMDDMSGMLAGCNALTSIDLSSFNTANVISMKFMFQDCRNMATIYVSDGWSTVAVTSSMYMFLNCNNLVGGMGTTYNSSHVDATYAHIDGGLDNPGYFTEKPAFTRGDVNGDDNVNITDVTALINYLLSHDSTGVNVQAADTNQDNNVTIQDVTVLINYLLSHQW